MSKTLKASLRKTLVGIVMITTIFSLSGVAALIPVAQAATIVDGDVIRNPSAAGNAQFDVYIVKLIGAKKFKRLVLNPQVFNSYGHLKWENIKTVDTATMNSYTTSALVRVETDPKVYALTPNDDTGNKSWLNVTAADFQSASGDWDSIYVINPIDAGNYAAAGDITTSAQVSTFLTTGVLPGGVPSAGTVTFTKVDIPSGTVPLGATGVTMTKFDVTAAEATTLTSLMITRKAVGQATDLARTYLYEGDTRLTTGKTISAETQKAEFSSLALAFTAGQKRTFTLVSDFVAAGAAGNTDQIELTSATFSAGTATGLPLAGAVYSIAASAAATLTIADSGSITNVKIGDQNAVLANFSLTPANEHVTLKRVTLRNLGTADLVTFKDFVLYDSANAKVADGVVSGRYVTFSGFTKTINNGTQSNFTVKATVGTVSNPGVSTVQFAVDQAADMLAIGNSFGYGAQLQMPAGTAYATNAYTDTASVVQGGQLTFTFNGPAASNVALNSQDVVLAEFTLSTAISGYVDTLLVEVFADDDADNNPFETAAAGADGADNEGLIRGAAVEANLKDIKVRRKSDNVTVWGPQELATAQGAADANDAYQVLTFNEDVNFTSGQSVVYQITADIDNNMPAGTEIGASLASNPDALTLNATNGLTAWDSSNNQIANVIPAIAQLGGIRGNIMTTTASSLAVAMASNPTSQTIVGGGWVNAAGIVLTAGSASKVTVSSITFRGFADGTAGAADYTAAEFDDTVSQATLWTGSTQLGTAASPDTAGNFTFSGFTRDIAAGNSETWIIKALPDTTLAEADASDAFYIDLIGDATANTRTTNISAVDKDGNAINATSVAQYADEAGGLPNDIQLNDGNLGAEDDNTPAVAVTVVTSGTLSVTLDGDTADSRLVLANTTGNDMSKYRFDALREPFKVETLTVANLTTAGVPAVTDELTTVSLYNGTTSIASGSVDANGRVQFSNAAGLFTVTPGTSVYVSVKVDTAAEESGTTGADSGDNARLSLWVDNNDGITDFRAVGANSSTSLVDEGGIPAALTFADNTVNADGDATTIIVAGNDSIVRKSKPTIVATSTSGTLANGDNTLIEFTVSASGSDDVTWRRVALAYSETGTFTSSDFKLYRASTDITNQATIRAVGDFDNNGALDLEEDVNSTAGDIVVTDGGSAIITVTLNNEETVSAGTSKTYSVKSTVAGAGTGESITTSMRNDTVNGGTTTALGQYRTIDVYLRSDTAGVFTAAGAVLTLFWDVNSNLVADAPAEPTILEAGFTGAGDFATSGEVVSTTLRRLTGANILLTEAGAADTLTFDANRDGVIDATEITVITAAAGIANEAYTTTNDLSPYRWIVPAGGATIVLDIDADGVDDATEPTITEDAGGATVQTLSVSNNLVWSDSSADIHNFDNTSADWANGFLVNTPTSSLSNVKKTLSL